MQAHPKDGAASCGGERRPKRDGMEEILFPLPYSPHQPSGRAVRRGLWSSGGGGAGDHSSLSLRDLLCKMVILVALNSQAVSIG